MFLIINKIDSGVLSAQDVKPSKDEVPAGYRVEEVEGNLSDFAITVNPSNCVFKDGKLTPSDSIKSDARLAAEIRAARVPLLDHADKKINTLEDRGQDASAWRAWRDKLRAITLQPTFPQSVVWPPQPVV